MYTTPRGALMGHWWGNNRPPQTMSGDTPPSKSHSLLCGLLLVSVASRWPGADS